MFKRKFTIVLLGLLTLGGLAGCGDTTAEDRAILDDVAQYVPLLVDKTDGSTYRNVDVNELKDGNDLIAVTSGVRKGKNFKVEWSYREGEGLATFDIGTPTEGATDILIAPGYEEYEPVFFGTTEVEDETNKPKPKIGRLIANLTLRKATKTMYFDFQLNPQWKITWLSIPEAKVAPAQQLIGVRGYVTGIFPDWNSLTIADGVDGYNFFKVMNFKNDGIAVGDLVAGVGNASGYNGLMQIGYIKRITILNPDNYPDIKNPAYTEITAQDFYDWRIASEEERLMSRLDGMDSALVSMRNLTLVKITDRDDMEIDHVPTSNIHSNLVVTADVTQWDGTPGTIEIRISLSYHMLPENQAAFDEFFQANKGKLINYDGPLTWYNEPNLGPYEVTSLSLA
jgi:hypothetical protein